MYMKRVTNLGKELDDAGEKINDVEKSLDRVGIKLRKNEKEWRNYYDVLDEVASKWNTFTDIEKSQVTTALGGKQKPSAVTYSNVWCLAV